MNKMTSICAVTAFVLVAGCTTRSIEHRELTQDTRDQQLHLTELVSQVRSAAHALETIFGAYGLAERSGLQLQSLTLSMEVTHAQGEDGHLAALVSASDDELRSADNKVVMTLLPTSSSDGESNHPLADTYRDYQPCGLGDGARTGSEDPERQMAVELLQASMAAVDAYLCNESRSNDAPFVLDRLIVTLSVDASRTDSGGLVLRLGNLSLGGEEQESAESVAKVDIDFARRSVD